MNYYVGACIRRLEEASLPSCYKQLVDWFFVTSFKWCSTNEILFNVSRMCFGIAYSLPELQQELIRYDICIVCLVAELQWCSTNFCFKSTIQYNTLLEQYIANNNKNQIVPIGSLLIATIVLLTYDNNSILLTVQAQLTGAVLIRMHSNGPPLQRFYCSYVVFMVL